MNSKTDYRLVVLISLCLVTVIIGVYHQTMSFDFVGYDDELYVTENLHVQKGISLEGIKWAFTSFHSANWHPLTWLSHMLDCQLYGMNPTGHHWTNVELHIANTLLLFFILFKMTGALWRSAFVAALFALHPLHVESVAWVSERKDVLSTFFGLLSIGAYYRYVKISSVKHYIPIIIFLSLGLMAKPMLVTIPFVLLLLDVWPLGRFQYKKDYQSMEDKAAQNEIRKNYRLFLEKIPLFIPVVISCILTLIAQKSGGAIKTFEALSLKHRISNAFVSYVNYVLKAIWPHKLAVFYPHPGNELAAWQVVGATLLIVAACFLAIKEIRRHPYIAVGLFWYLGTLVPVIGLLQVGGQAMADRYTYIPLIGIFIVIVWGISDILKRWRYRKIFFGISAAIILIALTWNTSLQLKNWKNGITLFEHTVKVTKNNYRAQNNLAAALTSVSLDQAISHYKAALKIKPDYLLGLANLGAAFIEKGSYDEAIDIYLKVLSIDPEYLKAHVNIGIAFFRIGNYDKAVLHFKKALEINPQEKDAHMNLANVLFSQGKPGEAISNYNDILKTDSQNADIHYNLAYVLSTQNKIDEAIFHYREALRVNPEYSKAYYNLGNLLMDQGKIKEAVANFAKAIQFKPDYVQVYNKLGLILFKQGKLDKAKVFFTKAIQIDPNYSEAHKNLEILHRYSSTVEH